MESIAMHIGDDGDDYLQLLPEEVEYLRQLDDDAAADLQEIYDNLVEHEATRELVPVANTVDIIPCISVRGGARDDSGVAAAVAEALKMVEAPPDGRGCPICLEDGGVTRGAWKETLCGHRFHGQCVERWLQAKGSCPMCRRMVV